MRRSVNTGSASNLETIKEEEAVPSHARKSKVVASTHHQAM